MLSMLPLTRRVVVSAPDQHRAKAELGAHLLRAVDSFNFYSQLRILDSAGYEIVRINRVEDTNGAQAGAQKSSVRRAGLDVAKVPDAELQFKDETDYFKIAMRLKPGEIYVSEIDLNEENGRIQEPLVTTLRIASPITDAQGSLLGIVVANLDGQRIFNWARALIQGGAPNSIDFSLLNQSGYWLTTDTHRSTWGWLLGQPDQTLARQDPSLWHVLKASDSSVVQVSDGLYLSEAIYPLQAFADAPFQAVTTAPSQSLSQELTRDAQAQRWISLLYLPESVWLGGTLLYQNWVQLLLALLVLFVAFVSWAVAKQRLLRQHMMRVQSDHAKELSDLYENAPCGYQSVDGQGVYVRINDTALEWIGYGRDELVGKMHFSQILVPDPSRPQTPSDQTHLEILKSRGAIVDYPMRMCRKDGSSFPVSLTAKAVYSEQGEFLMTRTTLLDVTQRRLLEDQLREQAFTDPLTGAFNRRNFFLLAEQELRHLPRSGQICALLCLDIDHFKQINDRFGHAAGDLVLKAFAQACQQSVRTGDIVARMGGEELAILLRTATRQDAKEIAERIRMAVENLAIQASERSVNDGGVIRLTVSIGLVCIDPHSEGLDQALSRADELLYEAKRSGRNRVVCEPD
ncbi:hypothetical protein DBV39_10890 [Orrella marina]|uniref:diguanylate cyclase n=2 Tax=Orrella marina TaxID=2163011 RepID=A0A2R4XJZ2_9BURK|nr:hypothetical protein DBV39_10890 [Orrella marina]